MAETTEQYRNRINQIKTSIENEPYMMKMREDIAEGVGTTGNRQADVEEQFKNVIDATTGKDVISAPELIAARNGEANLKARLDKEQQNVTAQLAQNKKKIECREKQTSLLSELYKNLNTKKAIKIIGQGDSLMYGQDTVSSDKRPPDSNKTDNGITHSFTRASKTIPEALENNLQAMYGSQVTVLNKGYSGDWVSASMNHWNLNSNADLAFVMLGTNESDQTASWVPEDVRGNLNKYILNIRFLIERYLEWDTPVILLTPPRLYIQEDIKNPNGKLTESYRNALIQLGLEYNIPVIDTESFLNGFDTTYYSDPVHLNAKGYVAFAARLTSVLTGFWNSIPFISGGDTLSVRVTRDNFIYSSGVTFATNNSSGGAEEGVDGEGILAAIPSGSWLHYSFESEEENLVLIPIFSPSNDGALKAELDFGTEQGSHNLLGSVNKDLPQGQKPLSSITTSVRSNSSDAWDGTINIATENRYLIMTQKGLHNIKVSNVGGSSSNIYFNGFVVISYKEFLNFGNISARPNTRQTHSTISDTTNVNTSVINMTTLATELGLKIEVADYWKNTPIRVKVFNYNENILEYIISVGGSGFTSGWVLGLDSKETKLTAAPNVANIRKLNSINYNPTTKELSLNWTGATNRATTIMISAF